MFTAFFPTLRGFLGFAACHKESILITFESKFLMHSVEKKEKNYMKSSARLMLFSFISVFTSGPLFGGRIHEL